MHDFKDGDWIRKLDPLPLDNDVYQLVYSDFYGVGAKSSKYFEGIEHWKPRVGEYIWDKDYGLAIVISYNEDQANKLAKEIFNNGSTFVITDCQPFIGKVPVFKTINSRS